MSGDILTLLALSLVVAAGAIALTYYLRRRGGNSLDDMPSTPQDSTISHHDVAAVPEQEIPPLSETQSRDETRTPAFDEGGEQRDSSLNDHEDNVSSGRLDPKTELGHREDDGRTPGGDSIGASQVEVEIGDDAGEHEERAINDGHESDSADLQGEIETASTPDNVGIDEEEVPVVEPQSIISDTKETEIDKPEAHLPVRSDNSVFSTETRDVVGEDAAGHTETSEDHLPEGLGDDQVQEPEPAFSIIDSGDAIPSEFPAGSPEQTTSSDGLDKNRHAIDERSSDSPGESETLSLVDRETSVPESALGVLADGEAPSTSRKPQTTEVSDASPVGGEVVEDIDISQSEPPPGEMVDAGGTDSEDEREDTGSAAITLPSQKNPAKKKELRKYKGLSRAAPKPHDVTPRSFPPKGEESVRRERPLPIEVRLRFERDGFCSVSLIPTRSKGLPEDLTAASLKGEVSLCAMQDEWYQDVFLEDISSVLRDGIVWTHEGGQCSWSLSGRLLYVLATHADISGYVSQSCLDIGRDHVVLCDESLKDQVKDAIQQTGAQPESLLDESSGAPPGWIVFQGVVPNTPVDPVSETDLFNALRPLPNIEISLERGIGLGYPKWLYGYPPSIRVYGNPEHTAEVLIDGQVATCGSDGAYSVSGWDSIGKHKVWCSGKSKSYSILPFDASWDLWEGHVFPISSDETQSLMICGPIVQVSANETDNRAASIPVPDTNPILIGAESGQIVEAMKVSAQHGAPRLASSSFRPVWALPRDPLHCDKEATRILLIAGIDGVDASEKIGAGRDVDVDSWCRFILDACRKGMKTEPDTEPVRRLWNSYRYVARRLWRSRR